MRHFITGAELTPEELDRLLGRAAQLKEMPRTEFDALAETLGLSEPLTGVGEAAFQRDSSIMGLPGITVLAWNGTSGVSVTINRDGDQAEMLAAAKAIAESALDR